MPDQETRKDRIRGCMLGGAVGDALGYAVEFLGENSIFTRYGDQGITAYELDRDSGKAIISDDTQMSLFTANGLLCAATREAGTRGRTSPGPIRTGSIPRKPPGRNPEQNTKAAPGSWMFPSCTTAGLRATPALPR